jgi:LmbE family N-acetylglucosaminyl deacetylase
MMAVLLAAAPRQPNGAELERTLEKLSVVGNVLFVAAHPDDEDTRLLAYLVNDKLMRVAYLSVTRGEGGQNLIGPEQGPLLGIIRTQELLAARGIDGAEQLFTRARDFGYSKTPDETLEIWGKDDVLSDVVWAVRTFKPDLIITRFLPQPTPGNHGHHVASAMLAQEAFRRAADPTYHPEQLTRTTVWQAKRVVVDVPPWGLKPGEVPPDTVKEELSGYSPRLGLSWGEIAAQSRSMHKSQGFGAAAGWGPRPAFFRTLDGDAPKQSLFEGIDFTWGRVPGSARLAATLRRVAKQYNEAAPQTSIPGLLEAHREMQALPESAWKAQKLGEVLDAIAACAGLRLEAQASDSSTVPGNSLKVTAGVLNRSPAALRLEEVHFSDGTVAKVEKPLPENVPVTVDQVMQIPRETPLSNPYWLDAPPGRGIFTVRDPALIGVPEEPAALQAEFELSFGAQKFSISRPVTYVWTDPVAGERTRRVEVLPPVAVDPASSILMFPDGQPKELKVSLKAAQAQVSGILRVELPERWTAQPASMPFALAKKGDEAELVFHIQPPAAASAGDLRVVAVISGQEISRGLRRIEHPHIPIQTLLPESKVKLVRFDLAKGGARLGYIVGAGDEVPGALRQAGYDVTFLEDGALTNEPLSRFDAIVVGVRAYSTNRRMPFYFKRLMSYVEGGGTLVVQYDTGDRFGPLPPEIGPYSFQITHDRVTDETAAVHFDLPNDPAVSWPNKLVPADFDGWIQERGLYFAGKWDEHYRTVLSMNDPGEAPLRGSLLIAPYGKGTFVYTGLAFFRQLPAGVPGAYRLFANLLARDGPRLHPLPPAGEGNRHAGK